MHTDLKARLDTLVCHYNTKDFIADDPVQILWHYNAPRDIEIMALLTAVNTWGRRPQIIAALKRLETLMQMQPSLFVTQRRYEAVHDKENIYRTFFGRDLKYICRGLAAYYQDHDTLEDLFTTDASPSHHGQPDLWAGIDNLRQLLYQSNGAAKYNRHIPNPAVSACKRMHLMLRWLVRNDGIVDLGIWHRLSPALLFIPLDIHVFQVARHADLLQRHIPDRKAVEELTGRLRAWEPSDPTKYDFALFGYGEENEGGNLSASEDKS